MDHSNARIDWDGDTPSPEIIAEVRSDIALCLDDLDAPEDLVFHIVILTDDIEGPSVTLTGNTETGGFTAEYSAKSTWVSINELQDD